MGLAAQGACPWPYMPGRLSRHGFGCWLGALPDDILLQLGLDEIGSHLSEFIRVDFPAEQRHRGMPLELGHQPACGCRLFRGGFRGGFRFGFRLVHNGRPALSVTYNATHTIIIL